MTELIDLRVVVPLDVDLLVTEELAGAVEAIEVGGFQGLVCLPAYAGELGSEVIAPSGFERAPQEWGSWSTYGADGHGQMTISAIAFKFQLQSEPTSSESVASADTRRDIKTIQAAVLAWVDRFTDWAQVVVRQALSAFEPSPNVVSRKTNMPLTWVEHGGAQSSIDSSPPTIEIHTELVVSALSERPADAGSFARIVALSNDSGSIGPAAVTFLTAGRVAAQRGRWRQALAELGTALEALLTDAMNLPANHRQTLGPMVNDALAAGIPLPQTIESDFVYPRNDVIHRGLAPSPTTVTDALAMMDSLVAVYYPAYACDPSLPLGARPQRYDLRIVVPQDEQQAAPEQ